MNVPATPAQQAPVIFGEVLFDCFPDGSRVAGGAPFNVAWHLQALGARPLLVSAVGEDAPGRDILARMQRWGMRVDGVQCDPGHRTGEVHVSLREGQPGFDIVEDCAYDHIRADRLAARDAPLLYHGSLALRAPRSAATLDALLDATGADVFMDVNLRDPWWQAAPLARRLDRARWVKLNDHELQALDDRSAGDWAAGARRLIERHDLELVILTRGEHGALLLDRTGTVLHTEPAGEVQVVDTVGAGDAFAAVCVLGLLRHWPLAAMLERAQRFASWVVTLRGATVQDPAPYRIVVSGWDAAPHPHASPPR